MLRISVNFFLNEAGIKLFPLWYSTLNKTISSQKGFISLNYDLNSHSNTANLVLDYSSVDEHKQWVASAEHKNLVASISPYFTKPPITTKNEVADNQKDEQQSCSISNKM